MKKIIKIMVIIALLFNSSFLTSVHADTTTFITGYMIVNEEINISRNFASANEGKVVSVYSKVIVSSTTPGDVSYYTTDVGKIQTYRLFPYTILTPTIYKTTRTGVPVWSAPRSSSILKTRISSIGTYVIVVGKVVKSATNIWYKTHAGNWIYSGNLINSYYQINTSEVQNPLDNQFSNKYNVFSEQINPSPVDGTCTLASYANMMRRYEILNKKTTYLLSKKENEINSAAWKTSLNWTITGNSYTPSVKMNYLTGTVAEKRATLINYLKTRPEGIVVYVQNYHAILLTDYDPIKNVFYVYDSVVTSTPSANVGRVLLKSASVLKRYSSEYDKINAISKVWVVVNQTSPIAFY